MSQQPVSYLQTDPRWRNNDYSAAGEKTTIGASGCGPTAMSMVLATWADRAVTPATECRWALKNGYKAKGQGTYYSYFVPAGKRYGLTVRRLNTVTIYGNSKSSFHGDARAALDRGDLVIACMGRGNWTSSGHYVLCWQVSGSRIFINDPASTKEARIRGDYALFKQQVKYYWVIQRPAPAPKTAEASPEPAKAPQPEKVPTAETGAREETNEERKEEETMTGEEIVKALTDEQAYALIHKAERHARTLPEPDWSKAEGHWQKAVAEGLLDGTSPEWFARRDELAAILGRQKAA